MALGLWDEGRDEILIDIFDDIVGSMASVFEYGGGFIEGILGRNLRGYDVAGFLEVFDDGPCLFVIAFEEEGLVGALDGTGDGIEDVLRSLLIH